MPAPGSPSSAEELVVEGADSCRDDVPASLGSDPLERVGGEILATGGVVGQCRDRLGERIDVGAGTTMPHSSLGTISASACTADTITGILDAIDSSGLSGDTISQTGSGLRGKGVTSIRLK